MSNLLAPAAAEPPARSIARRLLTGLADARRQVVGARLNAVTLLWRTPPPPAAIVAEMAAPDARAMMLLDVCQRLGLAVVEAQAAPVATRAGALLQAFGASSPVPATHVVDFLDAAGAPVDLAPELAALAAKLAAVEAVAVSAQPAA